MSKYAKSLTYNIERINILITFKNRKTAKVKSIDKTLALSFMFLVIILMQDGSMMFGFLHIVYVNTIIQGMELYGLKDIGDVIRLLQMGFVRIGIGKQHIGKKHWLFIKEKCYLLTTISRFKNQRYKR